MVDQEKVDSVEETTNTVAEPEQTPSDDDQQTETTSEPDIVPNQAEGGEGDLLAAIKQLQTEVNTGLKQLSQAIGALEHQAPQEPAPAATQDPEPSQPSEADLKEVENIIYGR